MRMSEDHRLPSDLSKSEMNVLAEHLESYLELLEDVFVIPDNILSSEKAVRKAIKTTHELIDRLKAGDHKVFKDDDECDDLI